MRTHFKEQKEMSGYINSRAAGIKKDKIFHINKLDELISQLGLKEDQNKVIPYPTPYGEVET